MKKWEAHWARWTDHYAKNLWTKNLKNREPIDPAYRMIAEIAVRNGEKILDIGCGGGVQAKSLLDINPKICYNGVDIMQSNICAAKKLFPSCDFEYGDATDLQFKDKEFDVAIIRHLIEHHPTEMAEKIIKESIRVANMTLLLMFIPMSKNSDIIVRNGSSGVFLNKYSRTWLSSIVPDNYSIQIKSILKPPNSPVISNQELYIIGGNNVR